MSDAVIAVFGSSRVPPESQDYQDAVAVGASLAKAGYTVMTGGYAGIMAGASQGANEAGGHVIGVTCAQIQAIRPIPANAWVKEEINYDKMAERLDHLMRRAAGYVVMPGGVGTLNELVLAWEYMRVREIPVVPLVCYGAVWERTLAAFIDEAYIPPHHKHMVQIATRVEDVVPMLQGEVSP
jgi:uncharacterized protein (TIGR00730 family)